MNVQCKEWGTIASQDVVGQSPMGSLVRIMGMHPQHSCAWCTLSTQTGGILPWVELRWVVVLISHKHLHIHYGLEASLVEYAIISQ